MRPSTIHIAVTALLAALLAAAMAHAVVSDKAASAGRTERRELVRRLMLTDLCLFTEARYTRHPAVADLATAFQDHPMGLEHFPSGALMSPPPHLRDPLWSKPDAER